MSDRKFLPFSSSLMMDSFGKWVNERRVRDTTTIFYSPPETVPLFSPIRRCQVSPDREVPKVPANRHLNAIFTTVFSDRLDPLRIWVNEWSKNTDRLVLADWSQVRPRTELDLSEFNGGGPRARPRRTTFRYTRSSWAPSLSRHLSRHYFSRSISLKFSNETNSTFETANFCDCDTSADFQPTLPATRSSRHWTRQTLVALQVFQRFPVTTKENN